MKSNLDVYMKNISFLQLVLIIKDVKVTRDKKGQEVRASEGEHRVSAGIRSHANPQNIQTENISNS